jgi:hypothetical protein
MRIGKAFCVELNEVVSIAEARREFFSIDPRPERFSFFCSDDECRFHNGDGVRVTGVNYDKLATESAHYKAAHFRVNSEHLQSCTWVIEHKVATNPVRRKDETSLQFDQRVARQKVSDFVDIFDPLLEELMAEKTIHTPPSSADEKLPVSRQWGGGGNTSSSPGRTKTSNLEQLADYYMEALAKFDAKAFDFLIEVCGLGTIRLGTFFEKVNRPSINGGIRVRYGNAFIVADSANEFVYQFYDEYQSMKVRLEVSKDLMAAYRYRKYVRNIVELGKSRTFVKVFAIGSLELSTDKTHYKLSLLSLRHLALFPSSKVREKSKISSARTI